MSIPTQTWAAEGVKSGVLIHGEGPIHIHDVNFKGFASNDYEDHCAITIRDKSMKGMGPSSSVKGLTFDFDEPAAWRLCHKMEFENELDQDETSISFRDLDGSLTGQAGKTLVAPYDFLHEGVNCESTPWNMTLCDGNFFRVRRHSFKNNNQMKSNLFC